MQREKQHFAQRRSLLPLTVLLADSNQSACVSLGLMGLKPLHKGLLTMSISWSKTLV